MRRLGKRSGGVMSWLILPFSIGLFGDVPAYAQVTPDGTLSTTVTQSGNQFTIDNGTQVGTNLFHSFQEFSIPTGGSAFFDNATNIQNIFSRVTGGDVSNIDGLIQANGAASLFLLNPNGILLGPNASLNIGGSFVGTTATHIQFADGVEFSATNPTGTPLLTVAVPIGLQMGANPGAIANQSQDSGVGLQVQNGLTLALIGGNLTLPGGYLTAADGHIELGSVGANSPVAIVPSPTGWFFTYQNVQSFQDIQLTQGALVDTTGDRGGSIQVQGRRVGLSDNSFIYSYTLAANQGGEISIRATEEIVVMNNSEIFSQVFGDELGSGGNIQIETPYLRISEAGGISTAGFGNTGNLTIQSKTIELIGGRTGDDPASFLSTDSFGLGQGGTLTITAESLTGRGWTAISASTRGQGNAGDVYINVQRLQALNGTQISSATNGAGNSGRVIVNATEFVEVMGANSFTEGPFSSGIFTSAEPGSTGNGGNVVINTGRLSVLQGGKVAANLVGSGNAGDITIRAREIEVADPLVDFTGAISGLVVSVVAGSTGQGGNLNVQTDTLRVFNGGQITAATDGAGDAGDISIRASSIDLSGVSPDGQLRSGITARSSTNFSAGSINLNSDRLTLRDGAEITVSNTSTGDAGTLNLMTKQLFLENGAQLLAEVNGGNQGNIQIRVTDLLVLRHGSSIVTNATGLSTGGNITINAPIILGLENSDIIANAIQGQGGNIQITTQGIFGLAFRNQLTPGNDITASSQFGISGTVQINNLSIDPESGLLPLPSNVTDTSQQLAKGCIVNEADSFIVTGRGGIPQNPTQEVRSDRPWGDLRDLSAFRKPGSTVTQAPTPINQPKFATGWIRHTDGMVTLIAEQPTTAVPLATCSGALAKPL